MALLCRAKLCAAFFFLMLIDAPLARADVIWTYVSQPYYSNTGPTVLGTALTAMVTIGCTNNCANGGTIEDVQLVSGTVVLDMNAPGVKTEFADIAIANNQVTNWALSLYSAPPGTAGINTWGGTPFSQGNFAGIGNVSAAALQGTWSSAPVGAPMPSVGTGLVPLLLGAAVLLFWRFRRHKLLEVI
jgi:hypothetical protein